MKTKTGITVKLIGEDGNVFSIIGKVTKAMKRAGFRNLVDEYIKEATSGDYDNALRVTMNYVIVE